MTNRSRQATDAVGERFVVISGCSGGGKSGLLTEFGLTIEHTLTVLHQSHRYHWRVFLTPPWAELYLNDDACRHDFNAAIEEYHRLLEVYPELGYEVYRLPKIGISERADYGLQLLGSSPD